jgi:phage host-nuclease inhibitor protein Gam
MNAPIEALEAAQEAYQDEENPSVGHAWRIENLDSADWALRRLGDLEQEMAENEAIAARRIEEIRIRTSLLNERAMRGAAFFRMRLTEYAERSRTELLKGGKKKTRQLPSGSIAYRSKGGGLVKADADVLLAWAKEQPVELELLRVKEEPAWDAIKKRFEATGEVPPGTDVEPEREEIVIKAAPKGAGNGAE